MSDITLFSNLPSEYSAFSYNEFIKNTTLPGLYRGEILTELGKKLYSYNLFLIEHDPNNVTENLIYLYALHELCELFLYRSNTLFCLHIHRYRGPRFKAIEQLLYNIKLKYAQFKKKFPKLTTPNISETSDIFFTIDSIPLDKSSSEEEKGTRPNANNPSPETYPLATITAILNQYGKNLVIVNLNGKIIFVSDEFAKLYGANITDLVGKNIEILIPENLRRQHADFFQQYITRKNYLTPSLTSNSTGSEPRYYDLVTREGLKSCEITIRPLQASKDDEVQTFIMAKFRDRTNEILYHQRQAELQKALDIANTEKTSATVDKEQMDRWIHQLLHDIRGPLVNLVGNVELCLSILDDCQKKLQEPDLTPITLQQRLAEVISALNIARQCGTYANDLGKEQLTYRFAQRKSKKIELTKFITNITEIARTYIQHKPIELIIVNELQDLMILGDEVEIKRILLNLLSNSIKYTVQGKVILHLHEIFKLDSSQEVCINFKITDTGPGMSTQQIAEIFAPTELVTRGEVATTLVQEGTGLGLKIVNNSVSKMQGKFSVVSEINHGSIFTVALKFKIIPHQLALETPHHSSSSSSYMSFNRQFAADCLSPKTASITALIIDDNPINIQALTHSLHNFNISIKTANNGREGLTLYKQLAITRNPEFIFMDISMPEMDGEETAKAIREFEGTLASENKEFTPSKIICISSDCDEEQDRLRTLGFNSFLGRDYSKQALKEILGLDEPGTIFSPKSSLRAAMVH